MGLRIWSRKKCQSLSSQTHACFCLACSTTNEITLLSATLPYNDFRFVGCWGIIVPTTSCCLNLFYLINQRDCTNSRSFLLPDSSFSPSHTGQHVAVLSMLRSHKGLTKLSSQIASYPLCMSFFRVRKKAHVIFYILSSTYPSSGDERLICWLPEISCVLSSSLAKACIPNLTDKQGAEHPSHTGGCQHGQYQKGWSVPTYVQSDKCTHHHHPTTA